MKIYLAKTAGFCMGVRRAVDKVMQAVAAGETVYTLGPLIHNPQEIERLRRMKVQDIESLEGVSGRHVVVRTHGISPEQRRELRQAGAIIDDATCPRVARVQGIIQQHAQKGYHTVIVGDRGHAEVIGLLGFTMGRGHVVSSEEEVADLPPMEKVCVVSQTTMSRDYYQQLVHIISSRFRGECLIFDTICDTTSQRQEEVKELCRTVQALIVVGGKNSANTGRLAQIASALGVAAFHIETAEELDLAQLQRFERVGVTAGASTPTWLIEQVVDKLRTAGEPA